MTQSALTQRTIHTPYQDNGRGGAKIDRIVLHHMASTGLEGVLSMWTNATREGSANYAIGNEGQIICAVQEQNRSWSLANYAFDARAITFEIENESLNGYTISAAATEATAQVVADVCRRYGIPTSRVVILGHKEVAKLGYSYPTACPGGLDLDAVVRRAAELLGQDWQPSAPAAPAAPQIGSNITTRPTEDVQRALNAAGYSLVVDDDYGPATTAAVTAYQRAHGLDPDGIYGPQTDASLFGPTSPAVRGGLDPDGIYGPNTCRAEQRALGFKGSDVDGIRGRNTIEREQRRTGAKPDGIDGPDTDEHLQLTLHALGYGAIVGKVDRQRGPRTIRGLQTALNDGKF